MKDRIRYLRKIVLNLSMAEFGEKIGLGAQAIAAIEKGRNELTDRNFDAICTAFSVNPEWLRNGVGEMFLETREDLIRNVAKQFELSDDDTILLRTFLSLPREHRAGVLAWARNFATTLAAQMGVQFPAQPQKPDSELTPDEAADTVRQEFQDAADAKKGVITTSSASTGLTGTSKKFSKSLE